MPTTNNFAPKGELFQAQPLMDFDGGYGIKYQFGIAKYLDKYYGTKRVISSTVPSVQTDAAMVIVPRVYFDEYLPYIRQNNAAVAASFEAILTPGASVPSGGLVAIGTASATNAGLSATEKIGVFTDGYGEVSKTTYDKTDKTLEELAAELNASDNGFNLTAFWTKNKKLIIGGGIVVALLSFRKQIMSLFTKKRK
jgi:hypothetical protein